MATYPRTAVRQIHCPRCGAVPGYPCKNREGTILPGAHSQRTAPARRAIQAALSLYAPLRTTYANTKS